MLSASALAKNLHEVLINEDEARSTIELEDMFVVQPTTELWFGRNWSDQGSSLPDGFRYTSETNPDWLLWTRSERLLHPSKDMHSTPLHCRG